ncbi:BTAD domain-containing putative transcriptional regulator [Nonomuraea sp. NPDC048916]|uniref:BTAD domain-containing putative transcriptional regulator n=1 Tax=Nonomuraea sp. NPDC048916 TaxID=3154232 RepID=UPI0033D0A3A1
MRVSMLGPVEIAGVRLTAPKPAVLLAMLIAAGGETVPNDRLVDALWPDRTPRSAVDNLRVYVAKLRRALGEEGRLVSRGGGYALTLLRGELDADLFGEAERAARRLAEMNDLAGSARAAREALGLWRGPAFDGLNLPDAARDYAQRLEERRTALTEDWIDLEFALGRHRDVVGELRALVTAHPLRERLHGQLMLALYWSGRRAEALAAYRAARQVMVEELGLEPGAELRALEEGVLRDDRLSLPRTGLPGRGPRPVPAGEEEPASGGRAGVEPATALDGGARVAGHGPGRPGRRRLRGGWWARVAVFALLLLIPVTQTQSAPRARSVEPAPALSPSAEQAPVPSPSVSHVRGLVGDGTLTVATLLPMTGDLHFFGAPMAAGAELAVQDVNAAGGVLDRPVRLIKADSGDSTNNIATAAVRDLAEAGTDVIIGPASNIVSRSILETVTEQGMLMISPSTTSSDLTSSYDRGLFFRTSPSDTMQGALVGQLVAEDGNRTAAFVAVDDDYGDVLVAEAEAVLARNDVEVVKKIRYNEDKIDFATLKRVDSDALVLIGFTETLDIMKHLRRGSRRWYLVDANLTDYSGDLPRGTLTGARGTISGGEVNTVFEERLRAVDPALTDFVYAAESYDAVVVAALAARAAKGDLGQSVAGRLAAVSGGGQRCTTFRECAELLEAGKEIDYDGLSGRIEFDSNGDVGEGTFGVYTYDRDNTYSRTETRVVRP